MNPDRRLLLGGALLAATGVAASALAYPEMPARMATHWNAAGDVNGTMPRWLGLSFVPALAVALVGLFYALPRADPRDSYDQFRDAYDALALATVAFVVYIHAIVLAVNAGVEVGVTQAMTPGVGGIYVVAGYVTARTDRNWFVGARTPWTLEDDAVWADTNRQVGRVFLAGGPVAAAGALVPEYAVVAMVAPAVAAAAVSVGYSYWRYRRA
jgi:uncharacterized membrane protein